MSVRSALVALSLCLCVSTVNAQDNAASGKKPGAGGKAPAQKAAQPAAPAAQGDSGKKSTLPAPLPPSPAGGVLSQEQMGIPLMSKPIRPASENAVVSDNQVARLASVRILSQVVALSQSLDGALLQAVRFNMERAASEGFLRDDVTPHGALDEQTVVVPPAATAVFTLTVNLAQGAPPPQPKEEAGAKGKEKGKPVRYAYRLSVRAWDGVLSDADIGKNQKNPAWSDTFNGSAEPDKLNADVMANARALAQVMSRKYKVK